MMLLADRLGYVQLAEPVRFTAAWEGAASLRLRQGTPPRWTNTTSTAHTRRPARPGHGPPGVADSAAASRCVARGCLA